MRWQSLPVTRELMGQFVRIFEGFDRFTRKIRRQRSNQRGIIRIERFGIRNGRRGQRGQDGNAIGFRGIVSGQSGKISAVCPHGISTKTIPVAEANPRESLFGRLKGKPLILKEGIKFLIGPLQKIRDPMRLCKPGIMRHGKMLRFRDKKRTRDGQSWIFVGIDKSKK